MAAAMVLPAAAALLWIAMPLGWIDTPDTETLRGVATHPLTRLVTLGLVILFSFHWAHRFRYTLYDGLQLYHLNQLIAVVTYGIAIVLSGAAAWVLWTLG
jgi:fumarate reductase subunit D